MDDEADAQRQCSSRALVPGRLYSARCTRDAVVVYRGHVYCEEHDPRNDQLRKMKVAYENLTRTMGDLQAHLDHHPQGLTYGEYDKRILQRTRVLVRDGVIQDPQLEEWCQRVADMEDDMKQQLQQKLKDTSARASALVTKIQNLQTAMRKDYAKKEAF